MEGLSDRAARGVALATLAVACVVVGPAPRLLDTFERTYAVALAETRRDVHPQRRRVPGLRATGWRPRRARPSGPRP